MALSDTAPRTGEGVPAPSPGPSPASPVPASRVRRRRRDRTIALAAVAPALLVVVGFMIYPVVFALYISLNTSDGADFTWVGLQNYLDLFTDPVVQQVALTNLKFLISVPLVIFVAIIVSVLLFERVRGWKFFRVICFFPSVLSTVVIGIMFRSAFGYYGPVNSVITALGGQPVQFFTETNSAIFVIVVALVWAGFGYSGMLLLSGLTAINPEVFEAAALDGAGWWARLWFVTLPNIRRILGFVFIINVLYTFTSLFGFIFVITAGGPGYSTTTLDYLVFLKAFSSNSDMGSGAALAVLLFLLIGVVTVVQAKFFKISEED
ncbi:carbohydrate ABC transporter permease [Leifsonia naganoensis]|uniref:ABC-type sugar transport system permease subunit n=1 Tax=Leifsonia naganoensis TaxID=150025 RepID=A0A853DM69_9MICO|nr:sugar ABC transporter permease [Leifsonia naganoensis]NYK08599.1 ABC-type sugar transport system permease subunit [Leifsonia naganoensis]